MQPEVRTASSAAQVRAPPAGWFITKPVSLYQEAVCRTCGGVVCPGEIRIRCGKRGAPVHHIKCLQHPDIDISAIPGFTNLVAEDRAQLLKSYSSMAAGSVSAVTPPTTATSTDADKELEEGVRALRGPLPTTLGNMKFWDQINLEDAAEPVYTVNTVPPQLHVAVARLRGEIAAMACAEAPGDVPDLTTWNISHVRALKLFLFLDRLLFAMPRQRKTGDVESLTALLARRVRHCWLGDWHLLFAGV